ncbi:hypothetical protein [Rugamonas apoptosis]|uniref:Uncharacterized protein n=1 Tax=Rugamonas apoptosis TaxID=2758570 RepID=A0A7W2IN70_9BURK|nr:hypothetical protein [Rugamonas apoptosis]MBA5690227.1 hypothetical protein [Rugamonas apoptosis]
MGGWYGWRLVCVVALLALGCRVGLAQIGPRYVLDLPAARHGQRAPEQGSIALEPDGRATIRVHGLTVALVGPDGGVGPSDLAVLSLQAGRLPVSRMSASVARAVPLVYTEPPAAGWDVGPAGHPMRAWDTLYLRKGQARLRVTAMPGGPGTVATAGFMLEIGTFHATSRIYVSCAPLAAGELAALPQRLPGAELVLAPASDGQAMALLRRAGNQDLFVPVAAPGGRYPFALLRR